MNSIMIPYLSKASLFIFSLMVQTAFCQDSELIDSLVQENCIQAYYEARTEAQIIELQEGKKKEWLKYLPTLGLTYTPAGEPRPGLSMSSTLIYTAYKDKQSKLKRMAAIRRQNELTAGLEIAKYKQLIIKIGLFQKELHHQEAVFAIDEELFEFYTKQYQNQELKPSAYLLKKKDFFNKQEGLRKEKLAIELLQLELKGISRCID